MKKVLALAILLTVIGTGAFALDWAVGGGGLFNYTSSIGKSITDDKLTIDRTGFGGFAFAGLGRFVELNFGFIYKQPQTMTVYQWLSDYEFTMDVRDLDSALALQFGAYFKWPFVLTDRLVLFPTLGVDYELTVNNDLWWNDLWFRAGAGLDVFFSERVFLRVHAIYGIGVVLGAEESIFGYMDYILNTALGGYYYNPFSDKVFSHGLLLKVGVGWMF